jgi:hypothetical protein
VALGTIAVLVLLAIIRAVRGEPVKIDLRKDGVSVDFPQKERRSAQAAPSPPPPVPEARGGIRDVNVTTGDVSHGKQNIVIGHTTHPPK